MSIREAFDAWAQEGKDRGMEERHWHTAKHALARMPIEEGDTVLDLGTGSGYALRALRERSIARGYGLDAAPEMVANARSYTEDDAIAFLRSDFQALPFAENSIDHAFSMEAIYYAEDPVEVLSELRRVLSPGGTVYCAVDYYEENVHSHEWQEYIEIPMTRWSREEYREAFREAGLYVAEQDNIPDREVEIPPADAFPTESFETREAMIERYHTYGTLLTVGVAP
ncbi:SAM-dependent methyltransferase [Halodesulfurarchaeum formicicum]|uniref:SAM-dependent methyltransferase n=1 Tax=Halodesulfurarchaeum formicicum TaxID=1873524 RepID=A0A1D8S795_9EURY|nr:class I SAM-dependent methyltransferase [Halodesulfurarchaeum formicicum]AOW81230.1 SAM-dependent methyltransferase [Halodesulfurarchaeum formicicum]APE96573.1 SAM-dependent methyltransferase [Halodesulfurarchaeum formicicum]